MSILPTLPEPAWLGLVAGVVAFLGGVAYLVYYVAWLAREVRDLPERVKAEISGAVDVDFPNPIPFEPYQLAQHNVDLRHDVHLLFHGDAANQVVEPYVAARFQFTNRGHVPTDLLACLVAGREVVAAGGPGAGRQGRAVNWESLATAPWNAAGDGLFQGLSTTRYLGQGRSPQLVRLDPDEDEIMLRFDALDAARLAEQQRLSLLYRTFVVVVSHRRYDTLSNRWHRRWRSVQYALRNLDSFACRLALLGAERQTGMDLSSADPLGRLAGQTGWRCFLLHHWDFNELTGWGPADAPAPYDRPRTATVDETSRLLGSRFPRFAAIPPDVLDQMADLSAAQLPELVFAWRDLLGTISRLDQRGMAFDTLVADGPMGKRYQALSKEGYLWAPRPLARPGGLIRRTSSKATPEGFPDPAFPADLDPFALERFAIRVKYTLDTVPAPKEE